VRRLTRRSNRSIRRSKSVVSTTLTNSAARSFASAWCAAVGTPDEEVGRAYARSKEVTVVEPLKVTLKRAKETKNTIRYEEPESGDPPIIGTLYLQKWATHRLEDPETITVTIEVPAGSTQSTPSA
jgi:hypothetical protein